MSYHAHRLAVGLGRCLCAGLLLSVAACTRPGPNEVPRPEALQRLYDAAQAQPTAANWLAVAQAEMQRRGWTLAIRSLEQVLEADPNNADALANLAMLRMQQSDMQAALALVDRLDKAYPEDADQQAVVADLNLRLGRREYAKASFEKALDLDPNQVMALYRLAQFALSEGKLDTAASLRNRLRTIAPDAAQVLELDLGIAQQSGDRGQQEAILRRVFERSPTAGNRAQVHAYYMAQGQLERAADFTEAWLAQHPNDLSAKLDLAILTWRRGGERNISEARQMLRTLVEENSDNPAVHLAYGELLLEAGETENAVTEAKRAAQLAGVNAELKMRAADLVARGDRPTDALAMYGEVLGEDPRRSLDAYKRIGMALQERGAEPQPDRQDPVILVYQAVLQQQPKDMEALNNLAFHYAEYYDQDQARLAEAKQLISTALEISPNNPYLLDTLAWVALKSDDSTTAATALERAIRGAREAAAGSPLRNTLPSMLYHRAVLLTQQDRRAEARAVLEEALLSGDQFPGRDDALALVARLEAER